MGSHDWSTEINHHESHGQYPHLVEIIPLKFAPLCGWVDVDPTTQEVNNAICHRLPPPSPREGTLKITNYWCSVAGWLTLVNNSIRHKSWGWVDNLSLQTLSALVKVRGAVVALVKGRPQLSTLSKAYRVLFFVTPSLQHNFFSMLVPGSARFQLTNLMGYS